MKDFQRYPFVLSIYPNTRGFAFTLFESSLSIVDWGVKEARGSRKNAEALAKVEALIARYSPRVVVLQEMSGDESHRSDRIRALNSAIADLALTAGIQLARYSRREAFAAFAEFGVATKQGTAEVIAKHLPALARFVPAPRKPWQSEDARMGLFDAAALALSFYRSQAGLN